MAYIIAVNPNILSDAGMEWGAVFLATIISAIIGTLVMGLFANVPYAQAPGMGLNAFFVYTVVLALHFTWQQALSMVFICGIVNIVVTITRVRKHIIRAIPRSIQHAISGGIGLFIAYIGFLNVGFINFGGGVPAMSILKTPALWLFAGTLILMIVLLVLKVKGAILISIVAATIVALVTKISVISPDTIGFADSAKSLGTTFGVIFTKAGIPSLFTGGGRQIVIAIVTIFSFSLTDTFDTIGTFIGTGRKSGVFTEADEKAMETSKGFSTKMDKALFADAIATSVGAIFGTSNTTTYVESSAGIAVGGKTGLTSVVVAILFALSAFAAKFVAAIPSAATAPALIVVGVMMVTSFADINWNDFEEAVPALFAGAFMAFSYSISTGIATAFIFYCIIKLARRQFKQIHPILLVSTLLFILNFVLQAVI
jgi:AGZA family xanthine/uracil permease-like MFS transporter